MSTIYRFTHFAHYLAVLSGLGYFIVIEFFKVDSKYGIRPHETQGYWQGFHILAVPFLVFAVGLLWNDHILKKLKSKTNHKRKSGIILLISFFLMTISGYLIQLITHEAILEICIDIHVYISFLWIIFYGYHQFADKLKRTLKQVA